MFEQAFKNIDDVLWKEDMSGELDYIEQTSWLLFLKYLDDLEAEKVMEAELAGKSYERIIAKEYQWDHRADPRKTVLAAIPLQSTRLLRRFNHRLDR